MHGMFLYCKIATKSNKKITGNTTHKLHRMILDPMISIVLNKTNKTKNNDSSDS